MARYSDDDPPVNKGGKADKVQRLAAQLLADRQRPQRADTSIFNSCFLCGRGFIYRRATDDNSGRFCGARCRELYDQGQRASTYHARQQFQMRMGKTGFWIDCPCGSAFESKGWKYCSVGCQRQAHQQAETASVLAEVAMEAPTKRRCQKPGCSRAIPRWRHGRRVSSAAKFCDVHNRSRKKAAG
jgi:hypothetical protein